MRKKNIKASPVNLTLNMRYKMTNNIKFCHHQIRLFKLKMHRNLFSARAPPRPPSQLGGGYPSQGVSNSAPRFSLLRYPSTKNPDYASVDANKWIIRSVNGMNFTSGNTTEHNAFNIFTLHMITGPIIGKPHSFMDATRYIKVQFVLLNHLKIYRLTADCRSKL